MDKVAFSSETLLVMGSLEVMIMVAGKGKYHEGLTVSVLCPQSEPGLETDGPRLKLRQGIC